MKGVENAQLLFGHYAIVKLNLPKIHEIENLVIKEISMIIGMNQPLHFYALMKKFLNRMITMETGYIIFSLKPGTKKDFIAKIRKIEAVKEPRLVIGLWDTVAKIETKNIEQLEKIYFNEIDNMTSITNSRLHIVACPRTRK